MGLGRDQDAIDAIESQLFSKLLVLMHNLIRKVSNFSESCMRHKKRARPCASFACAEGQSGPRSRCLDQNRRRRKRRRPGVNRRKFDHRQYLGVIRNSIEERGKETARIHISVSAGPKSETVITRVKRAMTAEKGTLS